MFDGKGNCLSWLDMVENAMMVEPGVSVESAIRTAASKFRGGPW